jgi:serine/threonine protein kinase
MSLAPGTRLGPYEIVSTIGAGAMGVVYKARDTRLGRDVAVKVLPPAFARDPDRLSRFEREARAVAAISHPNILSVHDIGTADVVDPDHGPARATYMITELLDGDTLRARLGQGALPPRKAADVAMQVARGLAAAHDRGIIHRDLKPENIVVLRDGLVKILDFGLAKQSAVAPEGSGDQQTMAATDPGTVLGTVGYMAPEQVRGEPADSRSDLFALGAVLHELASGQRAFARPTAAETMTAILREDPPDLAAANSQVPPALARVVRHALEKDPHDRFQTARDFAFALQALGDSATSSSGAAAASDLVKRPRRRSEVIAWAATALVTVAALTLWLRPGSTQTASASNLKPVIFAASLPGRDQGLSSPAVSPDGRRVAFIAHTVAGASIVVRPLNALQAQPIKNTTGVRDSSLFWSPDGGSLGFIAGGKLKTIELATNRLNELASAPSGYGGTWAPDGTILFSPDERGPIFRVSASGGDAAPVTALDKSRGDEAHRFPQFLPDGRHFVFMPWKSGATTRAIQLAELGATGSTTLFDSESAPVVAGHSFVYVRERPTRLVAQAFDPRTLALEGRPVRIVDDDDVDFWWFTGDSMLAASADVLVYSAGKYRRNQLTWFNRAGRQLATVGDPDVHYDPAISVDGTMLAVERRDAQTDGTDLWTVDLTRGAFSRVTSPKGFKTTAAWSPDGRRIAFAADEGNQPQVHVKSASGTGAEDVLIDRRGYPLDWSRDGRYLLYLVAGDATLKDVLVYDFERRSSSPVLNSTFNESGAVFSPNGKWIAYVSDESGSLQVYIRSFPDARVKVPISTAGGNQPVWSRDGRELFFLAPDTTLTVADVHESGDRFTVGRLETLFRTNVEPDRVIRNNYTISPDGQRILVMSPLVDPSVSRLVGVTHWAAGLLVR